MPWGEWGNCSRECGGGQQFRRREQLVEKYGGAHCEGAATESLDCNTHNCPSEYITHTQHIYDICINAYMQPAMQLHADTHAA